MIDFPKDKRKWTILHKIAHRYPEIGKAVIEVVVDYANGGVSQRDFSDKELIGLLFETHPQIANVSTMAGWQRFLQKVRYGEVEITVKQTRKGRQSKAVGDKRSRDKLAK